MIEMAAKESMIHGMNESTSKEAEGRENFRGAWSQPMRLRDRLSLKFKALTTLDRVWASVKLVKTSKEKVGDLRERLNELGMTEIAGRVGKISDSLSSVSSELERIHESLIEVLNRIESEGS